jgi:O-antigen ligase
MMLKLLNLVYIPLAIFTIALTGSRTSLLAVIPFGFYLAITQQIKFGQKILIFGILLTALLALTPFIPQSVITRLGTFGSSLETGDLSGRVDLWKEATSIFSNHPIIGLGSGTMVTALGKPVHNTFISVAAETGSIGFLLFFFVLLVVFIQAMQIPNGNSGLWIAIFLIWVIGVCSLSWEFRKPTWLFLNFMIIEASFAYEQLKSRRTKVEVSKNINEFLNVNGSEIKEVI